MGAVGRMSLFSTRPRRDISSRLMNRKRLGRVLEKITLGHFSEELMMKAELW